MTGIIINLIVNFGCGAMFYGIGAHAQKLKKPMGFWSGTTIKPEEIADIPAYNRENARMWKLYSLWYFSAAIAGFWSDIVPVVLLILSCTLGLGILIGTYKKIYNKHKTLEA